MLNLKHGGHVLANDAAGAEDTAKKMDVVILPKGEQPTETPFDYLFPQLEGKPDAHLTGDPAKVVAVLKALGSAMVDTAPGRRPTPRSRSTRPSPPSTPTGASSSTTTRRPTPTVTPRSATSPGPT